ncbi:MAG: ATP-binding protein [Bacteroidota bacterium]
MASISGKDMGNFATELKIFLNKKNIFAAVLFGLIAYLIVLADFHLLIPGTNLITDPREIFVTIGSALTGPLAGVIIGILSSLTDPTKELIPYIIIQHIVGAVWVGFAYKILINKNYPTYKIIFYWILIIFAYYYLTYLPVLVIVKLFFPDYYSLIIDPSIPLHYTLLILYEGWFPEFVFTTIVTSLAISALPSRYRLPLWGNSDKYSDNYNKQIVRGSLGLRIGVWFLILSLIPLIIVGVYIRDDVKTSYLLNQAFMHKKVAEEFAYHFSYDNETDLVNNSIDLLDENIFILDSLGNYIIHNDKGKLNNSALDIIPRNSLQKILSNNKGYFYDKSKVICGGFKKVNKDAIVVSLSDSTTLSHVFNYLEFTSLKKIGYGLTIISLLTGFIIWVIIIRPLKKLTSAVEEVGNGNYDIHIDESKVSDEIKILAGSFNRMTKNVKEAYNNLERMRNILKENEERLRVYIEKTTEGISFTKIEPPMPLNLSHYDQAVYYLNHGTISEANQALAKMYGFEKIENMLGKTLRDFWVGSGEELIEGILPWVKNNYLLDNQVTTEKDINGKIHYFQNNSVGLFDNNYLLGVWGVQRDITDKIIMEKNLRNSEHKLRTILDSAPFGAHLYELNEKEQLIITAANLAADKILGLTHKPLIGKSLEEAFPSMTGTDIPQKYRHAALTGENFHTEQVTSKDGKIIVAFEIFAFRTGYKEIVVFFRDISEQKISKELIDKYVKDLELKNAELERFTYTVSHDLKSPVITIKGFLGMIVNDAKEGRFDRIEKDIMRIDNAADKMQELLDDLLNLSRIGRIVNPSSTFSMSEAALESADLLIGKIKEKNISLIIDKDMPTVFADKHRIREVYQNLIENSVKNIGLSDSPSIEIGCKINNENILYFVKDSGIGIKSDYHEKIFELFEKLDPTSEGTGIGLSLVKRIIEFHGGKIWVESDGIGKGSAFYFTLGNKKQPE